MLASPISHLYIPPAMPLNQTVVNESSEGRLTVTLTIQEICRNANYTIVVFFGVQNRGGDNCDLSPDINKTATNVLPGVSRTFIVNDTTFKLGDGQKYCYNGSLIGDAGIILDGECHSKVKLHSHLVFCCCYVSTHISLY